MKRSLPDARAWRALLLVAALPVAGLLSAGPRAHVFAQRHASRFMESDAEMAPELSPREKFGKFIEVKRYDGAATRRASAVIDVPPRPATTPAPANAPTRAAPPE